MTLYLLWPGLTGDPLLDWHSGRVASWVSPVRYVVGAGDVTESSCWVGSALPASPQAVSLLEEVVTPRKDLPPLLLKMNERPAERLDYLGVSYGMTPRLLK